MSASAILVSTVLAVLFVLSIALLTGAVALLAAPPRSAQGRGTGALEALRLLDRQWRIERLVYRHHRLFGLAVMAVGLFCIWQLGSTEMITTIRDASPASVLVWALLFGQGFNLLIGLVILVRPSLLKPVEALANRWHHLDTGTGRRPRGVRATATLLALVGLVVLLASASLLIQQVTGSLV